MADFFAHASCYIDEGCAIGAGTKIWHFSHVMSRATIGRGCTIGQNVVVSPDVVIGELYNLTDALPSLCRCLRLPLAQSSVQFLRQGVHDGLLPSFVV